MRLFACAAGLIAALACRPLSAETKTIDLRTVEGVQAVKGEWRFANVKIVEIPWKAPDGTPDTTYDISPHAEASDFDDSGWEKVDPTTLGRRRGTGRVCFCWYRIKITLPDGVAGKKVAFSTVVDDYGELWVDGKLPFHPGQSGGTVVAGHNVPNRVELADPRPGKTYTIAVFGMNGPVSVGPNNYIFLGKTVLEIGDE